MNVKLPSISAVAEIVRHIKKAVPLASAPDARDYTRDDDSLPSIGITIGVDPSSGEWGWQSGDNSYTGGAYGFHYWGAGSVYKRSNSRELAAALIADAYEQLDSSDFQP